MADIEGGLLARFNARFGDAGRVHVVRAPGRVNLIGEHTDYNEGFVFPMAIEPEVRMACRGRDDGMVRVATSDPDFDRGIVEFSIDRKIERGEPHWSNYVRGVAAELEEAGIPLTGMDALIESAIPPGGGLSSSAALEVATALCLLTLGGLEMKPDRLAEICKKAEHVFGGTPCGIMDQTIVISAREGSAMLLDCRDLSRQFVPIDPSDLRVLIVNSMVRHALASGEYRKRREECEAAVRRLKQSNPSVRSLRDATLAMVEAEEGRMDAVAFRRARHVVSENARTVEAARLLGRQDYDAVGELMNASHASLRDDYEVSCEELDFLAAEAQKLKGVYGARMTGGGFGGCIVALVQPRNCDEALRKLAAAYEAKFGKRPQAYVSRAAGGASVLR